MSQELVRAQDLADKYRNLYELERRKNAKDGDHLPPVDDAAHDKLPNKESTYTYLGGNVRVNDVIRKNEVSLPMFIVYIKCVLQHSYKCSFRQNLYRLLIAWLALT